MRHRDFILGVLLEKYPVYSVKKAVSRGDVERRKEKRKNCFQSVLKKKSE